MRAAWYDRTGPAPDVLRVGELPTPSAGPGEALVRIRASGINPSDYKRRGGWRSMKALAGRVIPHSDGAGVVEDVGPEVERTWIGRRVWIWNAQGGVVYGATGGPETGTAAEYVALPMAHVVPLPDGIEFDVGACLGVPACTAHYAVFADGDVAGLTVLVQGGAGAVGEAAVQFARAARATVVATVSSPEKAARARAAGAQHVVNYRREDVVEAVRAVSPEGVDRIIEVDFGANIAPDAALIKPNGVIASYSSTSQPEPVLPYYPLQFKGATVRFVQGYLLPRPARQRALSDINRALATNELRPAIAARYPLEEIATAHELAESGRTIGNVVVTV